MVTFVRQRVVMMWVIVLASACARLSHAPVVHGEPPNEGAENAFASARANAAADSQPGHAPQATNESLLAHGDGVWPGAQDDARSKSARSLKYDTHSPRPVPERRPGLATQYGERRDSSITEVSFERLDAAQPQALLSLFYDDESGVEAKTGRDPDDALPGVFALRGGAVEVSIVSSWDNPLPHLVANGRMFIIGDSSDRYAIRVTNHSRERYEVVASVDGLDVISGTEATLKHNGYVLAPWSTLRIEGFRESVDVVRTFRFGEPQESYAVGRGLGRDIGVIGVALFEERTHRRGATEPSPFPGQFAPPPSY